MKRAGKAIIKRDYYEVLSITGDADLEEIKKPTSAARKQWHPYKN